MLKEWVISIRDQCKRARVPFFFKQWGGVRKGMAGRVLDGTTYSAFPKLLMRNVPAKQVRIASIVEIRRLRLQVLA